MVTAGTGTVDAAGTDAAAAAEQLVDQTVADLDGDPDFGFLFCSTRFDVDALAAAVDDELSTYDTDWVGCTTAGEITPDGAGHGGAVLLLVDGDDITFTTGVATDVHASPVEAGETAAAAALDGMDAADDRDRLLFTMIAGQSFTDDPVEFDVLNGIVQTAPDVQIAGGAAADDHRFDTTYQFCNGTVYEDAVVLAGISSPHPVRTGKAHGLHDEIASGVVTAAEGNVIKEINGVPAARFYADVIGVPVWKMQFPVIPPAKLLKQPWMVGSLAKTAGRYLYLLLTGRHPTTPQQIINYSLEQTLAVEVSGEYRVLSPVSITPGHGLKVNAAVQENQAIHVVEGETGDVVQAGKHAFDHVPEDEDPVFGVVSDCNMRDWLLSEQEQEAAVSALQSALGCPVAGFYAYGEIGGKDRICTFQNQTVSGFVVAETDADDGSEE